MPDLTAQDWDRLLCSTRFSDFLRHCSTSEGPIPNWKFIRGVVAALDSSYDIIILKRRQILMSWILSLYADWEARMHPHCDIGVTSIKEDDAKDFIRKARLGTMKVPDYLPAATYEMSGAKFAAGGQMDAYPSTETAGVSRTLQAFIMDEAAKHRYGLVNKESVYPALYKARPDDTRRRGRLVIASTSHPADGDTGFFYEEWQRATKNVEPFWPEKEAFSQWEARQVQPIQTVPIFISRWCRPDQQDPEWMQAEMDRMASDENEFLGSAAFDTYYPETPEMAFAGRQGLVFGRDIDGQLIFDPKRNITRSEYSWEECDWRVVGIDPGGRDPTAIVGVGVHKLPGAGFNVNALRQRHVFHALSTKQQLSVDDFDAILRRWNTTGHIHAIYIDTAGGTANLVGLQRRGWPVYPADKSRPAGFSLMVNLFKSGLLTIQDGPASEGIRSEVSRLRHAERGKGTGGASWATEISGPDHGDRLDATRYAVLGIHQTLPASYGGALPPGLTQAGKIPGLKKFSQGPRDTRRKSPWERQKVKR